MKFLRGSFIGMLTLIAMLFVLAPAAWAHAHPKVMTPAPDSVGSAPPIIIVTFSEAIEPRFSSLVVKDSKGNIVNKAHSQGITNDAKTLTLAMPFIEPGVYTVVWVSVAVDGHKMNGQYNFTVK
jgi:methionine-rich copper-binding protein CopC